MTKSCGVLRAAAFHDLVGFLAVTGSVKFRDYGLDLCHGVSLVVPEDAQVRPQRVPGHLQLRIGEMDGIHV